MPRQPMKDVIVLLPGITGSVLEKDGKVVWGFSARGLVKALFTKGRSMRDALMLEDDPPDVDDLGDGVKATKLIPDLHLLPGVWKIDGYTKVANRLKETFDITEGQNFFEFPYDWRRTNVVSARSLARKSHDWLKAWRETSGNADARLILVAHSMGGLVSRYFLEVMEGWKSTRALVTFGTPYRGSVNAVDSLANGVKKGPLELSEMSRSFTAIYQLLPIYKCYDPGDGNLLRIGEATGIPNVDADRASAALGFHREIQAAVDANRQNPAYDPNDGGYRVFPVVGLRQDTNQMARLVGGKVEMLQTYKGDDMAEAEDMSGDGTVPRVSAIPIEYSDDDIGMFLPTKHGSLQNADAALNSIEGSLSGLSIKLGGFLRDPTRATVALDVEDIFFDTEDVVVRGRPTRDDVSMTVELVDAESGQVVEKPMSPDGDGWHSTSFGRLEAGEYSVNVVGEGVDQASDSFAVGSPEEDG